MWKNFSAALSVFVLAGGASPAFAHAHLKTTNIADNAQLASAPTNLDLGFSEKTALAKFELKSADGNDLSAGYKPPKDMRVAFSIPLPKLKPGAYVASWRTIADDGHVMGGALHFSVAGQ